MYDINPLGPLMHLKELDRQAAPLLRPVRGQPATVVFLRGLVTWILAGAHGEGRTTASTRTSAPQRLPNLL